MPEPAHLGSSPAEAFKWLTATTDCLVQLSRELVDIESMVRLAQRQIEDACGESGVTKTPLHINTAVVAILGMWTMLLAALGVSDGYSISSVPSLFRKPTA